MCLHCSNTQKYVGHDFPQSDFSPNPPIKKKISSHKIKINPYFIPFSHFHLQSSENTWRVVTFPNIIWMFNISAHATFNKVFMIVKASLVIPTGIIQGICSDNSSSICNRDQKGNLLETFGLLIFVFFVIGLQSDSRRPPHQSNGL